MATGLDLIREENPALALIPDDELIEQILQQYQGDLDPDTFVESLLNEMPVESPVAFPTGGKRAFAPSDEPSQIGFGQALVGPAKSSWARSWGPSITRLRGGIAGLFGYEDTAQQLYEQAVEQDKNILQDSGYVSFAQATQGPDAGVSTFVKAGLSATGQSSPYLIEGITGALAGAKIGRVAGPWGVAIGAGVGAAVASFPRLFEFNISRQQEQVSLGNLDGVNEGLAAITALPQAAAESFMFPLMGKLLGPLTRSQMSNILSQATLGRVAKGSSIGIVTEAATEVGQQVLERYQAGLPIDTPEAIAEYTEAAYAGGFVGGLLGGVTTGAGEAVRATQPKPQEQKIEEPKVQEGIQQKPEATVLPEEQKAQSVNLAKEEEVKPATFNVEQQGDKFALNRIDETGNKTAVGGPFNTQQEATAKQQEVENQKSKVSQQTFFTKDEIIKENPAIGNIINELEEQGNTIAPHVKQVYFQKNLALPKGDFTNVQASGGTSNSVVDGWYDRTRDYVAIGTADLSKASETVGHENFHALQRHVDRSYKSGLFKQDEQVALDSYFPDNQSVDSIPQSVQKGLGKDVMARLRERHADRPLSRREMQAYAFGAYSSLKAQGKRMAAPNPVIRAFQRLWNLIKSAGNVFRKNKVNSVQDLFEKARTGEIGKRAVPKKGIEKLQTEGIAQAEEVAAKGLALLTSDKKLSLTTPITDKTGKTFSTILPTISPIGEFVAKQAYQRGLGGERLRKVIEPYAKNAVSRSDVDGSEYAKALSDIQSNETELNQNKEFIKIQDAEGNKTSIGDESGRFVNREYAENLQMLGNAYGTLLKVQAPTVQFALSTVKFRKKPPKQFENIKSLGKFLDKQTKVTDPLNDAAYNRALDAADKEIKYQLEKTDTGEGWYDIDVVKMFEQLQEKIPSLENQFNKDLFTALIGITSPQANPRDNVVRAARIYSYYDKFGALPLKQPSNTDKYFGRTTIAQQMGLLQYLLDTKGKEGTVDFLNSEHEVRNLDKLLQASGTAKYGSEFTDKNGRPLNYKDGKDGRDPSKVSGVERPRNAKNNVLGSYIFGNKVGSFYLNIQGIADKEGDAVTKDLWAARSFYRQFGQVVDNTKSAEQGLKGAFTGPHKKRGDAFFVELGKRNDLSPKDAQAVLWYYEHELFGELGIKNVPALYLSQGSKKYIDNFDKGKKYGTIELENRQPSIEITDRVVQKERASQEEETDLSVSEKVTSKDLLDFIKSRPDGFTFDMETGKEPTTGFAVAPIKTAELVVNSDKLTESVLDQYAENLVNIAKLSRKSVYAGGWLNTDDNFYYLDATYVVDNLNEALYIADASEQIAIFDIGEKNEIKTKDGIKQLKESGTYSSNAADEQRAGVQEVSRQFEEARDRGQARQSENLEDVIPTEFSLSEYNESDAVQYSVSDKLLSDKEIQDSELPSNVKAKLFLNRDIKKGTPISVRPNLNGRVIKGEDKLFVQTIHPGNDLNKALAYDGAVTLTNPELYVSQRARANIASKKQNKFPMAAGRGLYSTKEPSLEGQVLNFNPMTGHLFVDSSGYAVKSIKGDATFFNTKVYTEGELEYYTPENAPKPLDKIETQVLFKPDEVSEMDTLSQEQLIKYGLEFSVSTDKFSEGTERVLGTINPTRQRRTIPGYWKSLTDNWRIRAHQGIADQYSSVKKYIGEEPYKLLTMTHSSSGAIEGALNYGVPFLDKDGAIDLKDNTLGTGLFTRLEKLGDTLPNFLAWVAANRAKHLTTEGKETGLGDIKDINTAIKELPKGKEKLFNEVNKDINEFRDAFLKIARDSGYLSQEAYNAWTDNAGYNFYIPFYRLLEDETSNSGPKSAESIIDQPEVKKYVGSTLPVKDLFSNMLQNFNFLAEVSLKNQAGLKTLEQGESMGVTTKVNNPTKTSVFARKNGRMVHYEVNEPLVLKSLEALNWSGWSNPAMGILRNFKRYLTIGVTASPAFRIRNLIRDTIHSIAVSKISYNPLNNVLQGGKGFSLKGRKLSEARAKMAFGGGEIHFGHIYGGDPNATQMLLDRNIDLNTVMKSNGWSEGSKRFFKSKVGKGLDWWQEVGNTAENINRAALYQQLKAKGESHFEASYQARDLLNFSRHGANPAIRFLTQSIPFLNARIQGLDKAGRAFNQGQRAQLLTTLAVYSLASVGLYLAFKDDDDFKDREEWDRDTYHWFKIPGTETAFRIPRPFEVGAVGVMFERMVEQMVDDDVHGSLFAERMLHTITETFAIDYKPQLITPALEVYANKDTFTKRPIQSAWMEKLPPSERKYAYTSSAYVNASKALELIPWKAIQYSPVQIEHLVQGYFGWVGSSVAQVVSFSDYPRKLTQFTSAESPLFMGFVKPLPSIRTKYKTEFYEAMREMNEVNALMNMYMKSGETDKAMKIYNKNKNLIAWRSTYVKTNTQITKINRQIKLIESQKNLSEREKYLKVKQLNLLKAQIMRTLKENVLAYEKANDTRVKRPLWWK